MKPIYWVIIFIATSFFLLIANAIVVAVAEVRWLWMLFSIIIIVLGWSVAGIIILSTKIRKKPLPRAKIDIKRAKRKAQLEVTYDEDNPDNFKINATVIKRVGAEGSEKTPIAWFKGYGTETTNRIDVLMNLNKPDDEMIRVDKSTDKIIEGYIESFAENPDVKIIEERTQTRDQFGHPQESIKLIRSSSAQQREKEEKDKAEKASAL